MNGFDAVLASIRGQAAHEDFGYHQYVPSAAATEVKDTAAEENDSMKCSIEGCPGEHEPQTVIHTVRSQGRVMVIDHVPAEKCPVCGDVLFTAQTVRRIGRLLAHLPEPVETVPLFEYA